MKTIKVIEKLREKITNKPSEFQAVEDLFEMIRIYESENSKLAHVLNREVRAITAAQVKNNENSVNLSEKFYWLHKRSLLFDAPIDFDAYLQYVEFDREPSKKFYLPLPHHHQVLSLPQPVKLSKKNHKVNLLRQR